MSKLRIFLCGGRHLAEAVWSINAGFRLLGCDVHYLPTRKAGTKSDPIDNSFDVFSKIVQTWKPDLLLWVMCKQDCPPGLITHLRRLRPEMTTIFHSFDDPLQIAITGSPWALDFECAITCCEGSVEWYEDRGVKAACLYPPADIELHGRATPTASEACDFSFAATNVYARSMFPYALVPRSDLARAANKIGKLHLYGIWDENKRATWGGQFGVPELKACFRERHPYSAMPGIYAASRINLNSHCRPDGYKYLNERTITATASGGFCLTDRVYGIEEVLKPGVHFDTWGSLEEARDKMDFWLKNASLRERVARTGRDFVLARFNNVNHALDTLRLAGKIMLL